MSKLVTFLSAILLMSVFSAQAQTVDEIINKYAEALGGKDKLKSIQSVYQEGVSVMGNGNEITLKTWRVQDKLFRREITFGMGGQTTVITDKQGWRSNPRNGGAFEEIPAEYMKSQLGELDCVSPLIDYAAKGHSAELVGKETIDGAECYKIKMKLKSGTEVSYFIDPRTWYVVRESRPAAGMGAGGGQRPGAGGDGLFNVNYSNYQKTADGYVFPFTVTMGGQGAGMTYEKIEVNKPVDAKLYKPE
ncbi:MAG TPA: hypothetical protein VD996_07465 [Chitinophagaceae bacterium]|nr:hypothetical protein [Chitinophagaceae bacterium]